MEPLSPQENESDIDSIESFWLKITESELRQGDYLPNCFLPIAITPMDEIFEQLVEPEFEIEIQERDLIVITQSCDLENKKARMVALCAISPISEFEKSEPSYAKKGRWEDVRRGRVEGLHLLASPTNPSNSRDALVVDFREIHSLPVELVRRHATKMGDRWRLQSPYLEHFSQSFARVFMRVALPSSIPPFK